MPFEVLPFLLYLKRRSKTIAASPDAATGHTTPLANPDQTFRKAILKACSAWPQDSNTWFHTV